MWRYLEPGYIILVLYTPYSVHGRGTKALPLHRQPPGVAIRTEALNRPQSKMEVEGHSLYHYYCLLQLVFKNTDRASAPPTARTWGATCGTCSTLSHCVSRCTTLGAPSRRWPVSGQFAIHAHSSSSCFILPLLVVSAGKPTYRYCCLSISYIFLFFFICEAALYPYHTTYRQGVSISAVPIREHSLIPLIYPS